MELVGAFVRRCSQERLEAALAIQHRLLHSFTSLNFIGPTDFPPSATVVAAEYRAILGVIVPEFADASAQQVADLNQVARDHLSVDGEYLLASVAAPALLFLPLAVLSSPEFANACGVPCILPDPSALRSSPVTPAIAAVAALGLRIGSLHARCLSNRAASAARILNALTAYLNRIRLHPSLCFADLRDVLQTDSVDARIPTGATLPAASAASVRAAAAGGVVDPTSELLTTQELDADIGWLAAAAVPMGLERGAVAFEDGTGDGASPLAAQAEGTDGGASDAAPTADGREYLSHKDSVVEACGLHDSFAMLAAGLRVPCAVCCAVSSAVALHAAGDEDAASSAALLANVYAGVQLVERGVLGVRTAEQQFATAQLVVDVLDSRSGRRVGADGSGVPGAVVGVQGRDTSVGGATLPIAARGWQCTVLEAPARSNRVLQAAVASGKAVPTSLSALEGSVSRSATEGFGALDAIRQMRAVADGNATVAVGGVAPDAAPSSAAAEEAPASAAKEPETEPVYGDDDWAIASAAPLSIPLVGLLSVAGVIVDATAPHHSLAFERALAYVARVLLPSEEPDGVAAAASPAAIAPVDDASVPPSAVSHVPFAAKLAALRLRSLTELASNRSSVYERALQQIERLVECICDTPSPAEADFQVARAALAAALSELSGPVEGSAATTALVNRAVTSAVVSVVQSLPAVVAVQAASGSGVLKGVPMCRTAVSIPTPSVVESKVEARAFAVATGRDLASEESAGAAVAELPPDSVARLRAVLAASSAAAATREVYARIRGEGACGASCLSAAADEYAGVLMKLRMWRAARDVYVRYMLWEGAISATMQMGHVRAAVELVVAQMIGDEVQTALTTASADGEVGVRVPAGANAADYVHAAKEGNELAPPRPPATTDYRMRDPMLLVALGKATDDPVWFGLAWAETGGRYARAMNALGEWATDRKLEADALRAYLAALALNPTYGADWFSVGALAMKARRRVLMDAQAKEDTAEVAPPSEAAARLNRRAAVRMSAAWVVASRSRGTVTREMVIATARHHGVAAEYLSIGAKPGADVGVPNVTSDADADALSLWRPHLPNLPSMDVDPQPVELEGVPKVSTDAGELLKVAARAFTRAVQLNPTLLEGWVNLSACHRTLGDLNAAYSAATHAFALHPTEWRIGVNVLTFAVEAGKGRDAANALGRVALLVKGTAQKAPVQPSTLADFVTLFSSTVVSDLEKGHPAVPRFLAHVVGAVFSVADRVLLNAPAQEAACELLRAVVGADLCLDLMKGQIATPLAAAGAAAVAVEGAVWHPAASKAAVLDTAIHRAEASLRGAKLDGSWARADLESFTAVAVATTLVLSCALSLVSAIAEAEEAGVVFMVERDDADGGVVEDAVVAKVAAACSQSPSPLLRSYVTFTSRDTRERRVRETIRSALLSISAVEDAVAEGSVAAAAAVSGQGGAVSLSRLKRAPQYKHLLRTAPQLKQLAVTYNVEM